MREDIPLPSASQRLHARRSAPPLVAGSPPTAVLCCWLKLSIGSEWRPTRPGEPRRTCADRVVHLLPNILRARIFRHRRRGDDLDQLRFDPAFKRGRRGKKRPESVVAEPRIARVWGQRELSHSDHNFTPFDLAQLAGHTTFDRVGACGIGDAPRTI